MISVKQIRSMGWFTLAGTAIMLLSMAAGELWVQPRVVWDSFKMINYSGEWDLNRLFHADVAFAWIIPCSLILITYRYFSIQHVNHHRHAV